MIIDCIGCLHGHYPKLKGGDLLIVTGDLTAKHTQEEHFQFNEWLESQSYKKIILIAGNHDTWIEKNDDCAGFADFDGQKVEYLSNSGTEFENLKIWGSPWSSWFKGIHPKCKAFTYTNQENHYDEHISIIPHDTDILVTHEPAFGVLDGIPIEDGSVFHVGSKALLGWLEYVERPKLHVFSHIHEAYGQEETLVTYDDKMMISVNCSIMNEKYKPVNKPIRIEL